MTTSLIAPNLPSSVSGPAPPFFLPPMILPLPPGPTKPPPSESGFFFCFSTCTRNGFTIPDPLAPSPLPLLQPYFAIKRSANPFWPGRRERGAISASGSSAVFSICKASAKSASEVGMSDGAAGSSYRTGALVMLVAASTLVNGGGGGSAGLGSLIAGGGGGGGVGPCTSC